MKLKLLLIEDQEDIAEYYKNWLGNREPICYDVTIANSFKEANDCLDFHEDNLGIYNFAIIDVNLQMLDNKKKYSDQNGIIIAKRIVEELRFPFRFAFLSGKDKLLKAAKQKLKGYGLSVAYIKKGMSFDDDKRALENVLKFLEGNLLEYYHRNSSTEYERAVNYLSRFCLHDGISIEKKYMFLPSITHLRPVGDSNGQYWKAFSGLKGKEIMLRSSANAIAKSEVIYDRFNNKVKPDFNPFIGIKKNLIVNVIHYENATSHSVILKVDGTEMNIPVYHSKAKILKTSPAKITKESLKKLNYKFNEWLEFTKKFM